MEGCKAAKVGASGQSMGRARDVQSEVVKRVAIKVRGGALGAPIV